MADITNTINQAEVSRIEKTVPLENAKENSQLPQPQSQPQDLQNGTSSRIPIGKLTPENYLFLALECERLTMVNRSLVSENQQLSQISQKKIQELLEVNQKLNEEIVQLKTDLKTRDVKSIEILLNRMDQELEKRDKQANEKSRENENLKREIEKLKDELGRKEDLLQQKDQGLKQVNANTSKLPTLENQLAGLKKDKEKAELSVKDREQQLNELKARYSNLESDYWGARAEIQSRIPFLESEVERLLRERQAKEHHIEQLVTKLDEINAIEGKAKLYDENKLLKSKFVIVCSELERVAEKHQNLVGIIAEWLGATDKGLVKFEELTKTSGRSAKDLLGDPWIALITADDSAREALEIQKFSLVTQTSKAEIRVFNPENQEIVNENITTELTRPTEPNLAEAFIVESSQIKAEHKVTDLVELKVTTDVQESKTESLQQPEANLSALGSVNNTIAVETQVEQVKIAVELNVTAQDQPTEVKKLENQAIEALEKKKEKREATAKVEAKADEGAKVEPKAEKVEEKAQEEPKAEEKDSKAATGKKVVKKVAKKGGESELNKSGLDKSMEAPTADDPATKKTDEKLLEEVKTEEKDDKKESPGKKVVKKAAKKGENELDKSNLDKSADISTAEKTETKATEEKKPEEGGEKLDPKAAGKKVVKKVVKKGEGEIEKSQEVPKSDLPTDPVPKTEEKAGDDSKAPTGKKVVKKVVKKGEGDADKSVLEKPIEADSKAKPKEEEKPTKPTETEEESKGGKKVVKKVVKKAEEPKPEEKSSPEQTKPEAPKDDAPTAKKVVKKVVKK